MNHTSSMPSWWQIVRFICACYLILFTGCIITPLVLEHEGELPRQAALLLAGAVMLQLALPVFVEHLRSRQEP